MNHDEWLDKAEIYATGALDGEDLAHFEAHLAVGCAVCEDHIRETRELLTHLPRSLSPLTPPPAVKVRLLDWISGEAAPTLQRPRVGWLWWGIGAGALAAAGLLIALSWNLYETRQELQRLEGRVATLKGELAEREANLQFLTDPEIRIVQLAGLPSSPGATGRLLWNPISRTGLFLTIGLPQPPPDRAYELWAIAGAEPVPAGVFTVDRAGRALLRTPPLAAAKKFDKFAVTLEPAGGVQKPSGPMHLLGSL